MVVLRVVLKNLVHGTYFAAKCVAEYFCNCYDAFIRPLVDSALEIEKSPWPWER